jgi:hypothetical protein
MAAQEPIEWYLKNAMEPLFSHAEVLELADNRISHDTLQNWANREYIKPLIEGGKRRYSPLLVTTVILTESMVRGLRMDPAVAAGAIVAGLSKLVKKIDSPKMSKIAEAKRQIAVYDNIAGYVELEDACSLYDARKSALEMFNVDEAFAVLPLGRLLDALASKMRQRVEERAA